MTTYDIISRSGTRHMTSVPERRYGQRVTALCNFTVWVDEALSESNRDCQFCGDALAVLEAIERRKREEREPKEQQEAIKQEQDEHRLADEKEPYSA
jgi:hypothetical protein